MNTKLFILIAFFAIIVACIFATDDATNIAQNDDENVKNKMSLDFLLGPRSKKGIICWDKMVKGCCNNRCKGDGCFWFMCSACC
uniref:Uncharacterized protein n=1 Tax=Panagrolaimus superbus TaxID=310955 RepID=A0A914YAH0_9BILA